MAEFPALPLWTDAYLADTRHLTTEQHGAYLLLMMEAWRRPSCSLPDDDELLARLSGLSPDRWRECRGIVLAFWWHDAKTKTWHQKRLSKEREFTQKKSASQRGNALKRWNKTKNNDAMALPTHMPNGCQTDAPTPTPTYIGGGGSARALVREALTPPDSPTWREEMLVAMGLDPSGLTATGKMLGKAADLERAARWESELGLTRPEILAVIRETMAGKRDGPPGSFMYFEMPMARLRAAKDSPIPEYQPQQGGTPRRVAKEAENEDRLRKILLTAVNRSAQGAG